MWDECITLYVRNCLLCWQHDSINNQYKAKGKNKGFEEELTISHHLDHHHPHNHLAGRDFEEVWPGVRLLLGSTPSAPSAPPSSPSLQLHHYLYRYSDQNITDIRNGQFWRCLLGKYIISASNHSQCQATIPLSSCLTPCSTLPLGNQLFLLPTMMLGNKFA